MGFPQWAPFFKRGNRMHIQFSVTVGLYMPTQRTNIYIYIYTIIYHYTYIAIPI